MKRFALLLATIAFSLGLALAAQPHTLIVPLIVQGQPVATVCDGSAPILDQDTGSLAATRDADGRFIVAYQDRAHGSLAHVAQHVGATLEEVAAPAVLAAALPSFSPDGAKQGSLALVPSNMLGGKSRLYYTQRKAGDSTGPYGIWCMEF